MRGLRLMKKKGHRRRMVLKSFWMKTAVKLKLRITMISLVKSFATMALLIRLRRPGLAGPPEDTAVQSGGRLSTFSMILRTTGWKEKVSEKKHSWEK